MDNIVRCIIVPDYFDSNHAAELLAANGYQFAYRNGPDAEFIERRQGYSRYISFRCIPPDKNVTYLRRDTIEDIKNSERDIGPIGYDFEFIMIDELEQPVQVNSGELFAFL